MKITLLGTGTSQGVPVIGCDCKVCRSQDSRDNRLRTAALITHNETNILIDAGPDLRQQMLRSQVQHLDAILLTHEHNDHVIGLDDIRPFNFQSGHPMSVYAQERVAVDVRKRFAYIFGDPIPGLPRIALNIIDQNSNIEINGLPIQPISILHGQLPILGFRVGTLAYLTDVKTIRPEELDKIKGTRYLVINALRHRSHRTHLNLDEAIELINLIGPEQTWITHISHEMGLAEDVSATLPAGIQLAFDGLTIEF